MSLTFERYYPLLLAILATGLAWNFSITIPLAHRYELLSASISLGAILAGFLTTAKAIFMALPADSIKLQIKQSTYIEDLANYIAQGIWSCLIFCFTNLIGFFITSNYFNTYDIIWCGLAALSFASFVRVTHIMLMLFKAV